MLAPCRVGCRSLTTERRPDLKSLLVGGSGDASYEMAQLWCPQIYHDGETATIEACSVGIGARAPSRSPSFSVCSSRDFDWVSKKIRYDSMSLRKLSVSEKVA